MGVADTLRAAHRDLIEDNPSDVLLQRTVKGDDGKGGLRDTTTYVGLLRGRLYQQPARSREGEVVTTPGVFDEDHGWGLVVEDVMQAVDPQTGEVTLVDGSPVLTATDLQSGPNVLDFFDHAFGHFEVIAVYPRQDQGEVWGWDAFLRKVT